MRCAGSNTSTLSSVAGGERSAKLVMLWTVNCAAAGHPIPVAEKVASCVGFDMPRAVAARKADMEARE